MTNDQMIFSLNNILKHERKHFNFYLQALLELRGVDRVIFTPLLEKEMKSELEHIRLFGDKIVALGGKPTKESEIFKLENENGEITWKSVLRNAIDMEMEILRIYHYIYQLAEEYSKDYSDMSIVLLLEENIEHTTADVEEMKKILGE